MIKIVVLFKKKQGISDEEFYRYWKDKHGPLTVQLTPGLKKYVQNHPVKSADVKYDYDGITEFWFDDLEAYKKYLAWRDTEKGKLISADTRKFADPDSIVRYIVEEVTLK